MVIEERPWGTFEVLLDKPDHKVKEIYVKPNHRFSLQYHEYREEHWTIVEGMGTITQHGVESIIRHGEYAYIPKKELHRLEGGKDGITFIEVQRGDCREDDIIRLEDDYGRT
jgi:mannose-6-phosphate isomerase-like protein (cupin superfamily)